MVRTTGVQILTPVEHTLQAAGDLSIRFEISRIEGVTGDFTIKGLPQDETVPETVKFSSIQVKDDDKHLITAVNGEDCDKKQRFYLPEASVKEGKERLLHDPYPRTGWKSGGHGHPHAHYKLLRGSGEARDANPLYHQDKKLQTITII